MNNSRECSLSGCVRGTVTRFPSRLHSGFHGCACRDPAASVPRMQQPLIAGSPVDVSRRERRFFLGTVIALAIILAVGFSWSTYVRTRPGAVAFGGPTLPPIVRWHALVMTSWMMFLILRTSLVTARRTNLHRRLGVVGGVLAAAVVTLGWLVTFHARPLSTVQSTSFVPVPGTVRLRSFRPKN